MKKIDWKEIKKGAKFGWDRSGPSPQERWALYVLLSLLFIFIVVMPLMNRIW